MARAKERDAFAVELGRRIGEAWASAGFGSLAELQRTIPEIDYQALSKWARGDRVPDIRNIVVVAKACGVSLDWLILGEEQAPPAYVDWLESPAGQAAEPEARAFLRSLPTHGYRASTAFYDLALQAWRLGLQRQLSPDELSRSIRTTDRHR